MSGTPRQAAPTGGFAVVATVLNERLDFGGKYVSRQQVEAWHRRRTRNKAGDKPPGPTVTRAHAARTTPRIEFDTRAWVGWAAGGVPGPRRRGWVLPQLRRAA